MTTRRSRASALKPRIDAERSEVDASCQWKKHDR